MSEEWDDARDRNFKMTVTRDESGQVTHMMCMYCLQQKPLDELQYDMQEKPMHMCMEDCR